MRHLARQPLISLALATAVGTTLASASPSATAQTAPGAAPVFDIHVPAQALASALNDLSRQTGTQVSAAGDLVSKVTAKAVRGRLTAEQALRAMLQGSSLEATPTGTGGFAIRRAVEPLQSHDSLPTVTVTASSEHETASGPVTGYVAKRSRC